MPAIRLAGVTALLFLHAMAAPAADSARSALESQASAALDAHDWQTAFSIASEQLRAKPDDKFWGGVAYIAKLRLALDHPPRIRLGPGQLSESDQRRLREIETHAGRWVSADPETRASQTADLLAEIKPFAASHPDLTSGWILQAQVALLASRPLEGRVAARNLEELRAWETTNTNVLSLLGQLQVVGWMPAAQADDAQRDSLAKLSQKILAYGVKFAAQSLTERMNERNDVTANEPDAVASALSLPVILRDVKAFCRDHSALPNGWLLQYHLAKLQGRPLDQKVALSHLARPAATASKSQ